MQEGVSYENLGTFKLTAYCPCEFCCGHWSKYHNTTSQTQPEAGRTVSVSRDQIALGSVVVINGHRYIAEDTGDGIHENDIDIFMDNHEDAVRFGVQYAEVWVEVWNPPERGEQ